MAGCLTPTLTNLTPATLQRNESGLYPLEVAFHSRQQALVPETLQAFAMVGHEMYPMRPTPLVGGRWETLIPIPPGTNVVFYRFRFDWEYLAMPQRRKDSDLSHEYRLQIVE